MRRRQRGGRLVSVSVGVYRGLLWAYPARLRREFGADMAQVFRDTCLHEARCRGVRGMVRVWRETLGDWLVSVPREHVDGLRRSARWHGRLARPMRGACGTPRHPLHAVEMGPARHMERRAIMHDDRGRPWWRWRFWRRMRGQARPIQPAEGGTLRNELRPAEGGAPRNERDRFDKFTERVRQVLNLSEKEAVHLNHTYIGTEHLLLGLVRVGDSVAADVLTRLGVTAEGVRRDVEFIIGQHDPVMPSPKGLTLRAKKVIELAVDEARSKGHRYVGTDHLLLGLVREGEGIAASVLRQHYGLNLERVREETLRVLAERGAGPEGNGE